MAFFNFGRNEGFPARYQSNETPVILDVTETIFISVFVVIGIAYASVIPGYRKKQSIYMCVKVVLSITIGCLLIVNNFGQEWEVSSVKTRTPYRAGNKHEIDAAIGVKIGLRSVNVTLQGKGEEGTSLAKETINYNERFWWTWDQGKFGFGPDAGLLQRNFRAAQRKGLPIPILWVVEYFIIDGEGIRFGRYYRTAGWYCHILLWIAFAGWILANIFLQSVGRYAAYLIGTTGGLQILTCIVWCIIHNPTPLIIPFENGMIRLYFGRHFWMTLSCGLLCIFIAAILIFMDLRHPNELSTFLGTNPLNQYDECVIQCTDLENIMRNKGKTDRGLEMTAVSDRSNSTSSKSVSVLKRRTSMQNVQKVLFRCPVPVNVQSEEEDEAVYINDLLRPSTSFIENHSKDEVSKPPAVPKKTKGMNVIV
ncbi:PREDICTED: dual oxidase maturation factor 1-like [Dufourea novaeangliae]|uniref:dual oxidase maturation factor 1-like n=1 Tax=Dufourea novaeangliae TaxID=178035 RepID=UPI0007672291|nr:PREDICTED: dual oxidase maturation factor 1-like [Dufourea novaeangliae]